VTSEEHGEGRQFTPEGARGLLRRVMLNDRRKNARRRELINPVPFSGFCRSPIFDAVSNEISIRFNRAFSAGINVAEETVQCSNCGPSSISSSASDSQVGGTAIPNSYFFSRW